MAHTSVPGGANEIYRRHLAKTPFAQNPRRDRFALMRQMYEQKLTELAMNRFKWTGLPKEIDVRFLEETLFYFAVSIFYKDADYDKFMALRGGSYGALNYQNQPTMVQTNGSSYISKTLSTQGPTYVAVSENKERKIADIAVPIWANYLRVPDITIVEIYASKLAEIDRTLEINSKNARQTKYILTNENQNLTKSNILRQIDEGQDTIKLNSSMANDLQFIQALDLGVDWQMIGALRAERNQAWNDAMSLLGIDNSNQDKKERLVQAEATGNQDSISNMRYVNLNARRQACEIINRSYDLNVSVEYWTDAERNVNTGEDTDRTEPEE